MFSQQNKSSNFESDSIKISTSLKYTKENDIKKLDLKKIIIQIGYLKNKNIAIRYYRALFENDKIKGILDQLEATAKELRKQSEHERKELENIHQHSIKTVLQQKGAWDKKIKEANFQYKISLENLKKSEIELENYRQKNNNSSKILGIFYEQILRLLSLYENSVIQFKNTFGYNSSNSSQLIKLLKQLLLEQETFHLARNKWINARTLVIYSQSQIAFGIKKWKKIQDERSINEKDRYFICAESKNNFMAAIQNIESCQIYMGDNIQFPFVTKKHITKALNLLNIFFENVSNDKNAKSCLEIFKEMHLEVTNLIHWFQNVISENIMKDLEDNCNKIVEIEEKFHEERNEKIFNKYENIDKKILNYKEEDWEKNIEKLKTTKFMNTDISNIMSLSKPNDYNDYKEISLTKEHKLIFTIQQKINQFDVQKLLFENKKKMEIKNQENKFENELCQRKNYRKSYKFE